jgi:3,4-dihydroxy 2-butanone 4-phosphate synthase/GTP cyclohydrolase II
MIDKLKQTVKKSEMINLPTQWGMFKMMCYTECDTQKEHLVLVYGNVDGLKNCLIRVHSECATGDIFKSLKCDCGPQLDLAMKMVVEEGAGIIIYLKQEGRGIGIVNKINAYKLQEQGFDTVEANEKLGFSPDLRTYELAAMVLNDFGIQDVRLMTNNPAKVVGLQDLGIQISNTVPIKVATNKHNESYIKVKQVKMDHCFDTNIITN